MNENTREEDLIEEPLHVVGCTAVSAGTFRGHIKGEPDHVLDIGHILGEPRFVPLGDRPLSANAVLLLLEQVERDPEMRVAHETIYQSLFVQGRGHLRSYLHRHLRTGRALRRHRGEGRKGSWSRIQDMVMISDRLAEVEDRAVPGHREGDLIVGTNAKSAIGTLVERTTRYVMLLHLPDGRSADQVRDAMIPAIHALPAHLRRSLTWDQGTELARHKDITVATDLAIYFCDPHKRWQRGSNENTNGLLRQYFPKSTDLTIHTPTRLLEVAAELNGRPRRPSTTAPVPRRSNKYSPTRNGLQPPIVIRPSHSVDACPGDDRRGSTPNHRL